MKKLLAMLLCAALFALPCAMADASDDMDDMIRDAMEVYAWFTICPLDVNTDAAPTEDGRYPVFDDILALPQNLQARLDQYFSEDIARSLWEWDAYEPVNGWLYGFPPTGSLLARPIDPTIAGFSCEVTEDTGTRRVCEVSVSYFFSEQPETFEFVCEYQEEHWVFTDFPFFL